MSAITDKKEPKHGWRLKEKYQTPGGPNFYAQDLSLAARGVGTAEMIHAASPEVQNELVTNPEKYMK